MTHLMKKKKRMIYEGSCDIEDWSNDAKNSYILALPISNF